MQFALQNNVRCVLHLPEPFSPPALRLSARLKPRAGLKTADHLGTKEASELKAKSVRRSAGLQLPFHFAYETFAQIEGIAKKLLRSAVVTASLFDYQTSLKRV